VFWIYGYDSGYGFTPEQTFSRWAFGQPQIDEAETMDCMALAVHQFDKAVTGLQNNNCRDLLPVICYRNK
jgi:hypothetical protein